MKNRLGYVFLFLFGGLLLLAGLAFPQFVREAVLLPAATAVWLLLRIFVLSIHQQIFWWVAIVAAAVALLRGLFPPPTVISPVPVTEQDPVPDRAAVWRDSILLHVLAGVDRDTFRRDLMWVFTSLHVSRGQGKAKFQIRDDIIARRIPVAEPVYTFLFSYPRLSPKRSFLTHPVERLQVMRQSLARSAQEWVRRRTGREAADRLRSIDEILTFMEKALEMRKENDEPEVTPVS